MPRKLSVQSGEFFLLSAGRVLDGQIDPAQIYCLREIGRWLSLNGDSIYWGSNFRMQSAACSP